MLASPPGLPCPEKAAAAATARAWSAAAASRSASLFETAQSFAPFRREEERGVGETRERSKRTRMAYLLSPVALVAISLCSSCAMPARVRASHSFRHAHQQGQRCATAVAMSTVASCDERRQQRWDEATAMLEGSVTERRKQDHRAHLARLVGVYVGDEPHAKAELLIAMQPDQGGRKILFLDPADGQTLGFIELETLSAHSKKVAAAAANSTGVATSVLRGMLVTEGCRGKGYARLFLAIWLGLCSRAGVPAATSRINKPLLALTLVRLGFAPLRGRDKPGLRGKPGGSRKANQQPLAVEVCVGSGGSVLLYCSTRC